MRSARCEHEAIDRVGNVDRLAPSTVESLRLVWAFLSRDGDAMSLQKTSTRGTEIGTAVAVAMNLRLPQELADAIGELSNETGRSAGGQGLLAAAP